MAPKSKRKGRSRRPSPVALTAAGAWKIFMRLPNDLQLLTLGFMPWLSRRDLRGTCTSLRLLVNDSVTSLTGCNPWFYPAEPLLVGVSFPRVTALHFSRSWITSELHYFKSLKQQLAAGGLGQRLRSLKLDLDGIRQRAGERQWPNCGPMLPDLAALPRLRTLCLAPGVKWHEMQPQPCDAPASALTKLLVRCGYVETAPELPLVLRTDQLQHLRSLKLQYDGVHSGGYALPQSAAIFAAVVQLRALQQLQLQVPVDAADLAQLQHLKRLRELSVTFRGPADAAVQHLARLSQLTALTVLHDMQYGEARLESVLHRLTSLRLLRCLNVGQINVCGDALPLLALPLLQSLDCGALGGGDCQVLVSNSLRSLTCGDDMERQFQLARLRTGGGRCIDHLSSLDLGFAPLGAQDLPLLVLNTALRKLSIGLTDDVSDAGLASALSQLTRLTELRVRGMESITAAGLPVASTLRRLAVLGLEGSGVISDDGLAGLVSGLPLLHALHLEGMPVISLGFVATLLAGAAASLRELRLGYGMSLSKQDVREMQDYGNNKQLNIYFENGEPEVEVVISYENSDIDEL